MGGISPYWLHSSTAKLLGMTPQHGDARVRARKRTEKEKKVREK
jgi:hypothetical protein